MRGQDFTNWFDQNATPNGWVFPGQNFQVQSPIPAASATVTPDQWLKQTGEALGTLGAGTIQADVSAMYAVVGAEFGMPRGRWTDGAQMLWNRYSSTLSATWNAVSVDNDVTQAQAIAQWLSDLESSGLGAASVKWIQDSAAVQSALSKIGGVAQNVPWVNIVVAVARYAKFWVNGWSDKMDSRNGLQDYSTDFSWKPNLLKTGAYDLQKNGAQQDAAAGQAVIQAIRSLDLTDVFSPTSSDASAELRDGRLNSNQPWRPGWSVGMDAGDGSRLGCVPGTSAVSRRYDASAPVFVPTAVKDSDKICAPFWSAGLGWGSTGSYLPTLASLGSTLWQAASADSALMAGIDTTRAINRWRLACHHLAYEILNPYAWAKNPMSAQYGSILWANFDGSNQRCNFTATLETLWNTAGADLGWPALREVAWETRADMNLLDRPETSKAQVGSAYLASWAYSATKGGALGVRNYDPAQSGWASSRLANIVGLQCAPVVALESLRSRQRGKLYGDGEAPILLPYVNQINPEGPRGQQRVDVLRDLLQRPEICDVDAGDVPIGPESFSDASDLRDAIIIAQSNQKCGLAGGKAAFGTAITYDPPPPVVAPGLGLAAPTPGPSGSSGSALAALAAAAGLFWMMRR